MKRIKRKYIVLGVIILLLCGLILLLRYCNTDTTPYSPSDGLQVDEGAVDWEGNKGPSQGQGSGGIAIPGFDKLIFTADQIKQQVNFHNPATNDCLFLMTLYVENEEYWQSGYVEAGKGYYNIELYKPISAGEYDAELRIQCFRSTGVELNSARVTFDLTVLEETK